MGLCGRCLQLSLYTIVGLVAILMYFHLECQKEKAENLKDKFNPDFLPGEADCHVSPGFTKKGHDIEMKMGESLMINPAKPKVGRFLGHPVCTQYFSNWIFIQLRTPRERIQAYKWHQGLTNGTWLFTSLHFDKICC